MWSRCPHKVMLGVVLIVGCGKPLPGLTVLRGRVTIDGRPLPAGYVKFLTVDNVTQTGAELTPDGRYFLPGAPVGPVKIAVSTVQYTMTDPVMADNGLEAGPAKPNPKYMRTPNKYSDFDTSGLVTTIEAGQTEYNIELASK